MDSRALCDRIREVFDDFFEFGGSVDDLETFFVAVEVGDTVEGRRVVGPELGDAFSEDQRAASNGNRRSGLLDGPLKK